jgi:hypothetical protein
MRRPKLLRAFSDDEYQRAHLLLASRVASMHGRKMEEGDWADVYCAAKGIPEAEWSNLNIDVMHENLGVEHKMLCVRSDQAIGEWCGTTRMHPAFSEGPQSLPLHSAGRANAQWDAKNLDIEVYGSIP